MIVVFPTCVGMNRPLDGLDVAPRSVPHVCGDEPIPDDEMIPAIACSPRVWG